MKQLARSRWAFSLRSAVVAVAVVAVALGYILARRRWAAFRELAAEEEARELAEVRSVEKMRKTLAEFAANAKEHAALADTDDADERGYRLKKVREMADFIGWANGEIPAAEALAEEHAWAKKAFLGRW